MPWNELSEHLYYDRGSRGLSENGVEEEMLLLFPRDPLNPRKVDAAFEREWRAAKEAGFDVALIRLASHLIDESCPSNVDSVPEGNGETAIYRGWMMSTVQYATLYHALWKRGWHLINEPDEYRYSHELPSWYPDFELVTPKTVWFSGAYCGTGVWGLHKDDWPEIVSEVRRVLGDGPYIVKDFVKSRKHEWAKSCFIIGPDDIERVAGHFLKGQGDDLTGGLVFREFEHFKSIGKHTKSGIPLFNEVRAFVVRGHVVRLIPYWGPDEGGAGITLPTGSHQWDPGCVTRAKSNFFTVDLAQCPRSLRWRVIELGDGQVAGLPAHADTDDFYRQLRQRFV